MPRTAKTKKKKTYPDAEAHFCLWAQDKSGRSPKSPDWKGKLEIGRNTYDVPGWDKVAENGNSYISLALNKAIG